MHCEKGCGILTTAGQHKEYDSDIMVLYNANITFIACKSIKNVGAYRKWIDE